ncbi:MAG: hypothetical protein V1743_05670 [Nanoarchaeota archaeon]
MGNRKLCPDTKGQISMEYLLIVGFTFLMLVPLIVIFFTSSNDLEESITQNQADKIASQVIDSADEVFFLGPPAKKTIKAFFPDDVTNVEFGENYLKFWIKNRPQQPHYSVANISGNLSSGGGLHIITITSSGTGVEITDE